MIPDPIGCVADGTPVSRLEDVAATMELSLSKAATHLHATPVDTVPMGQSNAGIVSNLPLVHRNQQVVPIDHWIITR